MSTDTMQVTTVPEITLGWRMRIAQERSGLTVGQLADRLGYSRSQLSRWMHDAGRAPRDIVLTAWALATGVSVDWLRTGQAPTNDPDGGGEQQESATKWYGANPAEMGRVAHLQLAA